ncbi:hypothetical protein [Methylobacter sp. S3L5C]|nr:hypothetical protein [Methylobacter sp. S3L5C]
MSSRSVNVVKISECPEQRQAIACMILDIPLLGVQRVKQGV